MLIKEILKISLRGPVLIDDSVPSSHRLHTLLGAA